MAAKIADHYHTNGYFVAQAYLPAQDIKDGAVTIAVIEGRYGSVTLRNQSNLSNSLANGLLGGVNSGDTIAIAPLENRLLLLSDIPGVNVEIHPGSRRRGGHIRPARRRDAGAARDWERRSRQRRQPLHRRVPCWGRR